MPIVLYFAGVVFFFRAVLFYFKDTLPREKSYENESDKYLKRYFKASSRASLKTVRKYILIGGAFLVLAMLTGLL